MRAGLELLSMKGVVPPPTDSSGQSSTILAMHS